MAPVKHTPRAVARRQRAAQPPKQRFVDIVRERRQRNAKHSVPVMTAAAAGVALFVGAALVGAAPAPSMSDEQRALLAEANEPYVGAQKISIPEMELLTPPLALFPSRPLFAPQVSRVAEVRALPLPEVVQPRVQRERPSFEGSVRLEETSKGPQRPPVVKPRPAPKPPQATPKPRPSKAERAERVKRLVEKWRKSRGDRDNDSDDGGSSGGSSSGSSSSNDNDGDSSSSSSSSSSDSDSGSDSGGSGSGGSSSSGGDSDDE